MTYHISRPPKCKKCGARRWRRDFIDEKRWNCGLCGHHIRDPNLPSLEEVERFKRELEAKGR